MSSPEDEATEQGNRLRDNGDLDGAIAAYTEAVRLNPKNAQSYSGRGQAYLRKGEFDKAIADCDRAIELDPTMAEAYCCRADYHGRNGDFHKAIADCTEAIRLDPHRAEAYCTEAIHLDPLRAEAYWGRGHVYEKNGEFDKAIADLTECLRLDLRNAGVYCGRGYAYHKKGEFDKAIADYTEAISLNPEYFEAYYNRGCSYFEKGDHDQADADFAQAQELRRKVKPGRSAQRPAAHGARRLLGIVWASPYTLLGLLLGGVGLCAGGRVRIRSGVVEFYGGAVKWLLRRCPISVQGAMACTLGHTIFGQTEAALDISRDHEMVHVRQFERWGPLMGPAYVGCSLALWLMRRRPYRDNPFEREAYDQGSGE